MRAYGWVNGQTAGKCSWFTTLVDPVEVDVECVAFDLVGHDVGREVWGGFLAHAVEKIDRCNVEEFSLAVGRVWSVHGSLCVEDD